MLGRQLFQWSNKFISQTSFVRLLTCGYPDFLRKPVCLPPSRQRFMEAGKQIEWGTLNNLVGSSGVYKLQCSKTTSSVFYFTLTPHTFCYIAFQMSWVTFESLVNVKSCISFWMSGHKIGFENAKKLIYVPLSKCQLKVSCQSYLIGHQQGSCWFGSH